MPIKVVVNRSFGDFKLSSAGANYLFDNGFTSHAKSIAQVFNNLTRTGPFGYLAHLAFWQDHKDSPFYNRTVFSNDTLNVLNTFIPNNLREDATLVNCIETLGASASGISSNLQVVSIPNGTLYTIVDVFGLETIVENHNTWP